MNRQKDQQSRNLARGKIASGLAILFRKREKKVDFVVYI